jgi:hypothetical protein
VSFEDFAKTTLPAMTILGHCSTFMSHGLEVVVANGFDLRCAAGKTARVWLQGRDGALKPGQAMVHLPLKEGESAQSPTAYLAPLREALIDKNSGHVNVVVCESDYRALKRGIYNLPPGMQ